MRILLVEDSERLATLTAAGLANEGFTVDIAATAGEATAALRQGQFDAIILDLGLPDANGLSLIVRLREQGDHTPILIMTARLQVGDRVKGLDSGADDYLSKPFAFEELVARLRAILRRPGHFVGDTLKLGRMNFQPAGRTICVDGVERTLAPREAALLEVLLRRSGRVVSKQALEDQIYGFSEEGSANAVEVIIHRLRKQLREVGAGVTIDTVRGVGYICKELL